MSSVFARVFLDQAVFAPVSIVGLYHLKELLQFNNSSLERRLSLASEKLGESFGSVLLTNYTVWPGKSATLSAGCCASSLYLTNSDA